jgi:hypothetical protein
MQLPLALLLNLAQPPSRNPNIGHDMPQMGMPPVELGPSQEQQDSAKEFIDWWSAASYRYGREGKSRRDLLRNLYRQRLLFSQWKSGGSSTSADQAQSQKDKASWRSDFVTSITPIVQSFSNRGHAAIFSSDRPFAVTPEDPTGSIEDDDFPTSEKLEQLLNIRINQGGWSTQLYMALQDFVIFPATFGKIHYYEKTIPRRIFSQYGVAFRDVPAYACPILDVVDMDRVLMDWEAKSSDVQRWHGIGHRVDIPFHRVAERYREGVFHLNGAEVHRKWGNTGGSWLTRSEGWQDDRTRSDYDNKLTQLTAWEYHGLISQPNGTYTEGLLTVLTDRGAEDTGSGIIVRLQRGSALDCGLRPFVSAQFTPMPGPYGIGAIEPHLDVVYYLSQLYNLFIDCVRIGASPTICAPPTSELFTRAKAGSGGNTWYPGKTLPAYQRGDIWTLDIPLPNLPSLVNLIQHFERMLETRTGVSDAMLGMADRQKTATEAHGLFQALSIPLATRMKMFQADFLDPALQIALAMLQQYQAGPQQISFRGKDGKDKPVMISEEELSTGKYRVRSTMDREDQTRIAKAQSIERVLPLLAKPEIQMALQQEGASVSLTQMIRRYLDFVGIDDVDGVILQNRQVAMPMAANGGGRPGMPPGAMPPFGMMPGGPPGPGVPMPGGPSSPGQRAPLQLVRRGGPMGPEPTDQNALAQMLQTIQAGQAPNQEPPR